MVAFGSIGPAAGFGFGIGGCGILIGGLGHAPFAIDEFEFGEAQKKANMIEPLASGLRGIRAGRSAI
jgi:hypothetical protein